MSLLHDLQEKQKEAMKAKDKETLTTLRNALAAVKNKQIDSEQPLSDKDIVLILRSQVKQLRDAQTEYIAGNRSDLADAAAKELATLQVFLPAELSDEDLQEIVNKTIAAEQASGPSDIGKVMGPVMKQVAGNANGTRVRAAVEVALSS